MATSEEFRQLAAQHAEYERQLDAIEAKPHVTPEDEVEELVQGLSFAAAAK